MEGRIEHLHNIKNYNTTLIANFETSYAVPFTSFNLIEHYLLNKISNHHVHPDLPFNLAIQLQTFALPKLSYSMTHPDHFTRLFSILSSFQTSNYHKYLIQSKFLNIGYRVSKRWGVFILDSII